MSIIITHHLTLINKLLPMISTYNIAPISAGNFISNLFSGDGTPSTSSAATPNPTNRATTSEEEDLADYGPVEDTPPSSPRPGAPQELDLD